MIKTNKIINGMGLYSNKIDQVNLRYFTIQDMSS